jgi:hypothetical protein
VFIADGRFHLEVSQKKIGTVLFPSVFLIGPMLCDAKSTVCDDCKSPCESLSLRPVSKSSFGRKIRFETNDVHSKVSLWFLSLVLASENGTQIFFLNRK